MLFRVAQPSSGSRFRIIDMPMQPLVLEVVEFTDLSNWRWVLKDGDGGYLGDHVVHLDRRAAEHRGYLDLPAYLSHRANPDQEEEDNRTHLAEFGRWLNDRAFGPLTIRMLEYAPVTVRVLVPPAAQELVLRPFEAVAVRGKSLPLAGITLVFEVSGDPIKPASRVIDKTLRILAVFSVPPLESPLNLCRERRALALLVRQLIGGGRCAAIELRTLQYGTTRDTLRDALEEGDGWDIVHFSGHGMPGRLALERRDGAADIIDASELAEILRPSRGRLKLVTVSACHSGAGRISATLNAIGVDTAALDQANRPPSEILGAPVARALTRELDCAVLAMRFPVEDGFAIDFADALYRQMLDKQAPLPQALHRAVSLATSTKQTEALSPITPALFGAKAANLTLTLPRSLETGFNVPETGIFRFPAEPERFVGRVAVMTRASAALAPGSRKTGVLFHGMVGAGKSACAIELAYHLRQTGRFKAWVWFKAPDQGRETTTALRDLAFAMEDQLPSFTMSQIVGRDDELTRWLPRLESMLADNAVLIVLDNVESLLTETGNWRDPQFARVVASLVGHGGLSRVLLTSRVRPAHLPESLIIEAIHGLPLAEAMLLMSEPPRLYRLFSGAKDERILARRLLQVIQGHPKLIELAEGMADDQATLSKQVDRAELAWHAGENPIEAFFNEGQSAMSDDGFLEALSIWTAAAAAILPEAARLLFHALCTIEERDREDWVINAAWLDIWARLAQSTTPAPPISEIIAPLIGAALVEPQTANNNNRWSIHPGVAAAGFTAASSTVRQAIDQVLGNFWGAVYEHGRTEEAIGGGQLIRRAGLAAAPYLLRLKQWSIASTLLEQVILRDDSPATVSAVLPLLQAIAAATIGTAEELYDRGKLAKVLRLAGRAEDAERELRQIVLIAADRQQFRLASGATGELINLLSADGRAQEALALTEEKSNYTRQASLGPWTQLLDEGKRLSLLAHEGQYEEVLQRVQTTRSQLVTLPEVSVEEEAAISWNVRETLFDIGRSAAVETEQWEMALDFNRLINDSHTSRGATPLEQARARYNDYLPLLSLHRYDEVRILLTECREVFQEEDPVRLGSVLSAQADLEDLFYGPRSARRIAEVGLGQLYRAAEPASCATAHFNLSNYLMRGAGTPMEAIAHRLAAIIIGLLTASDILIKGFDALRQQLADLGPTGRVVAPKSFVEICTTVDGIDRVRFQDLANRLNAGRFDLDDLVHMTIEKGFELAAQADSTWPTISKESGDRSV
jgi:hypothetical protein